jgi:signal transduction histidine kinase
LSEVAPTEVSSSSDENTPRAPRLGAPREVRWFTIAWAAAYISLIGLLLWSRNLNLAYLGIGAAAWTGALIQLIRLAIDRRAERSAVLSPTHLYAAIAVLGVGLFVAGVTAVRLHQIAEQWQTLSESRDAKLRGAFEAQMRELVSNGAATATRTAAAVERSDGRALFNALASIRAQTGVAAIAAFDSAGELTAWTGDHRGMLPQGVRTRTPTIAYEDRPLFSYLYFGAPLKGRAGHVVVAQLLQTGLPPGSGVAGSVADAFASRSGARPEFGAGANRNAVWTLMQGRTALVHATFPPATQLELRNAAAVAGRRIMLLLGAIALLLLSAAWLHARGHLTEAATAVPLACAAVAFAVAPLGGALGLERLFSPALYMLPLSPGDISLGALLAILLPLGALVATTRPVTLDKHSSRRAIALGTIAVAIGFMGGIRLVLPGASWSLLEGGSFLWLGLQPALVLLLAIIAGLAMPQGGPLHQTADETPASIGRVRKVSLVVGLLLSGALALFVLGATEGARPSDPWVPALWAVPFLLCAIGIANYRGRGSRLARWLVSGWLAATCVLPQLWTAHVDARLKAAERELSTLGTRPDPYLDYLLRQFALVVSQRHAAGEDGVQLIYRSWKESGLGSESYPTRIALWDSAGRLRVDLGLGGAASSVMHADSLPFYLRSVISAARTMNSAIIQIVQGEPNVNQTLAIPLPDGEVVTVVVPPRRAFERASVLSPFLGTEPSVDARLTLIPVGPGQRSPPPEVHWRARPSGYRSETVVHYPEGDYHAHLELLVPSVWVRIARGVLLNALDLGILTLLWVLGRAARGEVPSPPGGWSAWFRGFRARVTFALVLFFLLPTAGFGYVAYRALAGEVERAAQNIAEHAALQASTAFPDSLGDLRALAAQTGEEVLYYHRTGELLSSSSPEALELGLFSAWMSPEVFLNLQSGEEMTAVERERLGAYPYLAAFRRLPVTGIIAVPVSLASGDTAIRQRELAHIILFAALIGALLSLSLSVAVGRALTHPIGQLRRASLAVGAGQLRVNLPEGRHDEFGELFASFNRMARRLRRARKREVRTARVLAWGEMARQIAHEIKNPLTPIKLSVQHLLRAYGDGRADFGNILQTNVAQILNEIDRLSEIARAFSRYGAPAGAAGPLELVAVSDVVHEALTLYRAGDLELTYVERMDPDLPPARARVGELKEVVLNLLENARSALHGVGTVTVSATREDGSIVLTLSDNGPGIPPELLPRIFEPHFSTRTTGTGLGLAIVRRLVESWGGEVTADSEPGAGTTVRVRIPAALT